MRVRSTVSMLLASLMASSTALATENGGMMARQKLILEATGFEKDTVLGKITYHDAVKLDSFDAVWDVAMNKAREGGAPHDIELVESIRKRQTLPFQDFDLKGEWQCRTIKVGGLAALVVYDWFKCQVSEDELGNVLEKRTGSQRTKGRFYTDGPERLIYLGGHFIAGNPAPSYGLGRETDHAGFAFRDGPETWRITFPAPERESVVDILELRRPQ